MKKITRQFIAAALMISTLAIVSCNNDDATGNSTLQVADGVEATVDIPFGTDVTVDELNEDSFQYTITLSEPQSKDVQIRVKQISGTADADDFEFSEIVVIPAYTTTGTGTIKIHNDDTVEGVENFSLQIGDASTANASFTPSVVNFTINNYLSDSLDLAFNFNKSFSIAGNSYTLCGVGYDMDFYVLDAGFNDFGIYQAATGNCVEKLTLTADPTNLPDGTYHIFYGIYDDVNLSGMYHDPMSIPVTVDYMRSGGITSGTFTQEEAYVANSTQGTDASFNGNGYVVTIEVAGGVYTLKNSLPEVIASGKTSKIKASLSQAKLRNRR